jgi:hypothetical protein
MLYSTTKTKANFFKPEKSRVARWYIKYQKSQIWDILEGLGMELFGLYYRHLACFKDISYVVWRVGIVCGNLGCFFRLLVHILYQEKSGNPGEKKRNKRSANS